MNGLTRRQDEILCYIRSFIEENGRSPSLSEISSFFSISPAGASCSVAALEKKGLIEREKGKARGIALSRSERMERENEKIPLFSSEPSPDDASSGSPSFVFVPSSIAERNVFAFRVSSLSMVNCGILPGDMALVERRSEAANGSIVLASSSPDTSAPMELRRLRSGGNCIELWPENDSMGIIRSKSIALYGVLIEIRRSFK